MFRLFLGLLPNRPVSCRILRGPFRGAKVRLNPRSSLRKIFGLYEHELNKYIASVLPKVTTLYDIGMNDGYFALGCCAFFSRHQIAGSVYGFEPQNEGVDAVNTAAERYRKEGMTFEITKTFVDDHIAPGVITLDEYIGHDKPTTKAFIKIDVEGAEARVLRGASKLLNDQNHFVIELHSKDLKDEVCAMFRDRGLKFEIVNQKALPILGREHRAIDNWWLITTHV